MSLAFRHSTFSDRPRHSRLAKVLFVSDKRAELIRPASVIDLANFLISALRFASKDSRVAGTSGDDK